MIQNASFFLALRYLRPKRNFVSVITLVSLVGVAVGVLMMIVVRSVMAGFEADFRDTLMGSNPHIMLRPDGKDAAARWPGVLEKLQAQPGVLSAVPCATDKVYLAKDDAQALAQLLAVPAEKAASHLTKLRTHLLAGSFDLAEGSLVLTDQHMSSLGLQLGDEFSVYAGPNVNEAVRQYSEANEQENDAQRREMIRKISLHPQKLRVSGVLRSEAVGLLACASLRTAQAIFRLGDHPGGIALELAEPEKALERSATFAALAPGWQVETWADQEKARLAAMRNEQTMMQFVLSIIALVAAFSVMNTTITVTTQKRREIGMLAAIGSRPSQIIGIFTLQAVIVGVLGTLLGLIGGLLVLWLRDDLRALLALATGGQIHAVEGVFLSTIPARLDVWHISMTCVFSILLCITAGLIPAWIAARLEPAAALRD